MQRAMDEPEGIVGAPEASERQPLMNADLPLSTTERTTLHRLRERGRTARADLHAVLDAGLICHLGVVVDGSPVVLPTGYGRVGDRLYLHGSSANRALLAAGGQQVCVTVTHLDGLVCARSVFHHSMNYRSAMIFGVARLVTGDPERLSALRAVSEQLVPGRWDHARPPARKELAATAVLELPLDEASVKVRSGPPKDDPEDYDTDIWAGVVPTRLTFGAAEPDPDLRPGIGVPTHISALVTRGDAPGVAPASGSRVR
jgi:nitroimidazol reductase NimA-like FMN-containing flavoprotein (pyridoxamine 5'-phosphate oxidase superfamily)